MNQIIRFFVAGMTFFVISLPASAVQPSGGTTPSSASISTLNVVERGGTINAINSTKGTIVVDGVSYAFSAESVIVNDPSSRVADAKILKVGMQIRFSTSKEIFSGRDKVREIWITSVKK